MYERLMNVSIARSRTRGSPRWKEKTMMIACKPDIPLHEPLYHLQLTSDEYKICSPKQLNKESMKRNIKTLKYTCMQMKEDNLVENLQCTTEAW
jgi:hypothetical protein